MLLFYCTTAARLPRLRAHGASDALLWRTLSCAAQVGGEAVLVVNHADCVGLADGGDPSLRARLVPPAAFRNLSPYRPPLEVVAAGGVVLRTDVRPAEALLIHRQGRWDLPKGKTEPGEPLHEAAAREVREETGIADLLTYPCIGATLHGYARKGRYHVKRTYWYLMQSRSTTFCPELAEGISEVRWMQWNDAIQAVGYPSLQRLLRSISPLAHVEEYAELLRSIGHHRAG